MAYKPWYEQISEITSVAEKQEFLKGVYGGYGNERSTNLPVIAGLIAGYLGGKAARKNN